MTPGLGGEPVPSVGDAGPTGEHSEAMLPRTVARWADLAVAIVLLLAGAAAEAQTSDVALVSSGERAQVAADAFVRFVALPNDRRYAAMPNPRPAAVAFVVTLETDVPLVRVWRRRDGAVLERRFDDSHEDGYAIAFVAAELLEVARTGGDPASIGATVAARPPSAELATEPTARDSMLDNDRASSRAEVAASGTGASEANRRTAPEPERSAQRPRLDVTLGLGAEAWLGVEERAPWMVQPALFIDLAGSLGGEPWLLSGALLVSGLGSFSRQENGVEGRYQRYDVALRVGLGGDLGEADTRLLGHVRAGASAVVGRAEQAAAESAEVTRPGWFIGASLEGRQPLWEGLELTAEVSADVLPAPVTFTAFGQPLVEESLLRFAARLGLAWRFR